MHVLFASSELFPLVKTGGLADVSASLTRALHDSGVKIDLIIPAYRTVQEKLPVPSARYRFDDAFLPSGLQLLEHRLADSGIRLLLVDYPLYFDRAGGPYLDAEGVDWPDNALRFGLFCRAIVALLAGRCELRQPWHVVHCNDWQTGLVPAFVQHEALAVWTVLTIHNLGYQGNFSFAEFRQLSLPDSWWSYDKLEFYGQISFLKAGIVFADHVTTVSPGYAREILSEPAGCGMAGLLQHHQQKLQGILNGIDPEIWNPAADPLIRFHYDATRLADKLHNKLDLQRTLGLKLGKTIPLIGIVSRLAHQKGIDWAIEVMVRMTGEPLQWVVLGGGDKTLEQQLQTLAERHPEKIAVTIGHDEVMAHRIEAGCDFFLMPSRYEPCGLNQLYSLRYGTLPIVRATGGLADTVVDTNPATLKNGTATGFSYSGDSPDELEQTVRRALTYYPKRKLMQTLQRTAMGRQFDWRTSAQHYLQLYRQIP